MADLSNKDKGEFTIVDPDDNAKEAKVDTHGSMQNRLFDESGNYLKGQKVMASSVPVVLSSDHSTISVQTEAEASGSNDRLFVINAEINNGSSETELILITNPGGSAKKVKIHDITVSTIKITNAETTIRIYKIPTITSNGSAISIIPTRIGASLPTSAVNAYESPSTSSYGTQMYTLYVACGPGSAGSFTYEFDGVFILDPGYSILITAESDGTNRLVTTNITWEEVDV